VASWQFAEHLGRAGGAGVGRLTYVSLFFVVLFPFRCPPTLAPPPSGIQQCSCRSLCKRNKLFLISAIKFVHGQSNFRGDARIQGPRVLVGNFETNPKIVRRSCFVGVSRKFSPLRGTNSWRTNQKSVDFQISLVAVQYPERCRKSYRWGPFKAEHAKRCQTAFLTNPSTSYPGWELPWNLTTPP